MAYRRFSGEAPIDFDHAMQLMGEHETHDLHVWPQGWPNTHLVGTATPPGPSIDLYLEWLRSDLLRVQQHQAHLFHVTNDLRLLTLKNRRLLAGFLLYFHLAHYLQLPQFRKQNFGPGFLDLPEVSNWLDRTRDVLHLYNQVPSTEYWSVTMLNSLAAKIKMIVDMNALDHAGLAGTLQQEVLLLIDQLEHMVSSGTKVNGGAPLRVFSHNGLFNNDFLLSELNDGDGFLYHDCGLFEVYRFDLDHTIQQRWAHIQAVGKYTDSLTDNSKLQARFFKQIRENVAA